MTRLIAFQGVRGAYSEQAVVKFFKTRFKDQPYKDFEDVFKAVLNGKADFGVIPIENSLTGSIHQNYDLLLKYKVWITGEIKLRVSHNLLAPHGTKISDIRQVYSHPQALMQCDGFLKTIKKATSVPYFDTAGSAHFVADQNDKSLASIASAQAAKEYDLKVVRANIEDNEQNFTRFIVITSSPKKKLKAPSKSRFKTSVLFALKKNIPGGLFKALTVFAIRDIDLLKIESRPIPGKPWQYIFYLDFEGESHTEAAKRAISHLEEITEFVKVLGSFRCAEK